MHRASVLCVRACLRCKFACSGQASYRSACGGGEARQGEMDGGAPFWSLANPACDLIALLCSAPSVRRARSSCAVRAPEGPASLCLNLLVVCPSPPPVTPAPPHFTHAQLIERLVAAELWPVSPRFSSPCRWARRCRWALSW